MCSGVIVMIRTITTWPKTSAVIAARTAGRRRSSASRGDGPSPPRICSTVVSASSYGSGRSMTKDNTAAAPTNTIGSRYGPVSTGSPMFTATSPENATRFGPTTAPTVAPQTTSPSVEARRPGGTRSAAA